MENWQAVYKESLKDKSIKELEEIIREKEHTIKQADKRTYNGRLTRIFENADILVVQELITEKTRNDARQSMINFFTEHYGEERLSKLAKSNNHLYTFAFHNADIKIIDKLLTITTLDNYYINVRKFTKDITSDKSISSWQRLAELREIQLLAQEQA